MKPPRKDNRTPPVTRTGTTEEIEAARRTVDENKRERDRLLSENLAEEASRPKTEDGG